VPHHKSAKKRVKTNEVRRQRNVAQRSHMRHAVRDLRQAQAMAQGPSEELTQQMKSVGSLLDRMSARGIIHRNKAARLKSRLVARMPG
jgi:small subunit ribosomal protein S20